MKKVTVRSKVAYTNEGARSEAVFADTQESAGYLAGWSGEYLAVRLNGERKTFSKRKDAVSFLETQEIETIESGTIKKGSGKVIGYGENKRLTKAQKKKYGIL